MVLLFHPLASILLRCRVACLIGLNLSVYMLFSPFFVYRIHKSFSSPVYACSPLCFSVHVCVCAFIGFVFFSRCLVGPFLSLSGVRRVCTPHSYLCLCVFVCAVVCRIFYSAVFSPLPPPSLSLSLALVVRCCALKAWPSSIVQVDPLPNVSPPSPSQKIGKGNIADTSAQRSW